MRGPHRAGAAGRNDWTDEQEAIFACREPRMGVRAFAGSGKTTTCREYALRNPRDRFLYLVFGKENQRDAAATFPPNVVARTTHSIAYQAIGHRFVHKLGDAKVVDVARRYRRPVPTATAALALIQRFCGAPGDDVAVAAAPLRGVLEASAVPLARELWADMCDPDVRDVPIGHEGYLKLFDVGRHQVEGFDVILCDEFQDLNGVTLSILARQRRVRIVAVGDSHQRIFGFRGSVDGFERFAGRTFDLSASFRFGPEVADVANAVLALKGEARRIDGRGGPSRVAAPGEAPARRHAFLARSNAAALLYAASSTASRVHFVGDLEAYRPARIRDAHALLQGRLRDVADREFRQFKTFKALVRYAKQVDDVEILAVTHFAERHAAQLPQLLDGLASRAVADAGAAEVVVSTAHKAKGLEFDEVVLGHFFDVPDLVDGTRRGLGPKWAEELNLLYVAATRARRVLHPNPELRAIVEGAVPRPGAAPRAAAAEPQAARRPAARLKSAFPRYVSTSPSRTLRAR